MKRMVHFYKIISSSINLQLAAIATYGHSSAPSVNTRMLRDKSSQFCTFMSFMCFVVQVTQRFHYATKFVYDCSATVLLNVPSSSLVRGNPQIIIIYLKQNWFYSQKIVCRYNQIINFSSPYMETMIKHVDVDVFHYFVATVEVS